MRRAVLSAVVLLAGCGENSAPERGVDTTLPAEPAKISGSLTAPSEYMPEDLSVCAETVDGKTAHCDAEVTKSIFTGSYSLTLPPGSYRVYARTKEVPNYKAYYSRCSSTSDCASHSPIVVDLKEGDERTGVDPVDWFNRPATPSDEVGTGYDSYDPEGDGTYMNVDENLTTTDIDDTPIDDE